jgi:ribosome-associated protein
MPAATQKVRVRQYPRTAVIVVRYCQEAIIRQHPEDLSADPPLPTTNAEVSDPLWLTAVRAAQSKKAQDVVVLDLREITSLADYFVICTGTNVRQNQAISDEIHVKGKERGEAPISVEGYENAEWVLLDYGDVIVHVFLDKTRTYYDLERLWRHARKVEIPPEPVAA